MPSITPTSFLTSQDKRNSAGELAISTTLIWTWWNLRH